MRKRNKGEQTIKGITRGDIPRKSTHPETPKNHDLILYQTIAWKEHTGKVKNHP